MNEKKMIDFRQCAIEYSCFVAMEHTMNESKY